MLRKNSFWTNQRTNLTFGKLNSKPRVYSKKKFKLTFNSKNNIPKVPISIKMKYNNRAAAANQYMKCKYQGILSTRSAMSTTLEKLVTLLKYCLKTISLNWRLDCLYNKWAQNINHHHSKRVLSCLFTRTNSRSITPGFNPPQIKFVNLKALIFFMKRIWRVWRD